MPEQHKDSGNRNRIVGADPVKQAADKACQHECQSQSQREPKNRQPQSLQQQHEPANIGARGSKGHASADRVRAQLGAIRHHAVNPRCRQDQGNDPEDAREGARHLRGFTHRARVEHRNLCVDFVDRLLPSGRDIVRIASRLHLHDGLVIRSLE